MRIAIQIERFDPTRGGAEGYAAALARGLFERGHQVTVIAEEARGVPQGVEVRLLEVPSWPRTLRILAHARASAEAARRGSYEIVHALGKSLGMNILNPHGGVEAVWLRREYLSHPGALRRGFWAVKRRLSPRHHAVLSVIRRQYADPRVLRYVALSAGIREAMVQVHGVDPSKIVVVRHGTDTVRFRPPRDEDERLTLRESLGLPADRLIFLFVGNNFRLKGLEPLVRALAALRRGAPPHCLVVLGRGKPGRYLSIARALGAPDLLEFRGSVPRIEEWYRAADGLLHPTFFDSAALVLLEARASGLPVLGSRHAGASEVIEDGVDGAVVGDPHDPQALTAKLRLFFDPAWRARAGSAARAGILAGPPADPAEAMLEVYRDALENRPPLG